MPSISADTAHDPSPSENANSSIVARCRPRAWRQHRDCFDQIGLAGAVDAGQHHGSGLIERKLRGVIAAEVREGEAANEGGGHCGGETVVGDRAPTLSHTGGKKIIYNNPI